MNPPRAVRGGYPWACERAMTRGFSAIDELMERASVALVEAEYFDSERLCARALRQARAADDFERMTRICLPLQEARRQIRQLAEAGGVRAVVDRDPGRGVAFEAGCYVLQPPLLGVDAVAFRESAWRRKVPVFVLTREPMTRAGKWPMVAVAEMGSARGGASEMRSVRAMADPPAGVAFTGIGVTGDRSPETGADGSERAARRSRGVPAETRAGTAPAYRVPSLEWFTAAGEAVGDAAIAAVDRSLHPVFQADDLMDLLAAIPEHEKLHQRLEEVCREAARVGVPVEKRRIEERNPWSF